MVITARWPVVAAAILVLAAACGSSDDAAPPAPTRATPPEASSPSLDGLFDVGTHKLAVSCWGTGTPTVVYLHGFIQDAGGGGAVNAGRIPRELSSQLRVCAYDRANVGASGKVVGRQTGADSVRDLHTLLAVAKIPPPYVLLGASFGGLIATMYAANYPAEVQGMVLLDASLPDDLVVERRVVGADKALPPPRWQEVLEQLDQEATYQAAQALMQTKQAMPVTYLAAKDIELPPSYPADKMVAAIRQTQRAFVARYSPGRLVMVDAPHFMEPEIPYQIMDEVRRMIAQH